MYVSEIIEYTNRKKMEETTGKVFSRLHQMKSILCKTFKKTPQFCSRINNHNGSFSSPRSYFSVDNDEIEKYSELTDASLPHITSDDTISSISGDSSDSGVSTLSDFSHCSLISSSSLSTSLHHRTATIPSSYHLRCDPSIINYVSHHLLTTHRSECCFLDDGEESPSTELPLAESSRRTIHDNDQTIVADDDDDDETITTTTTGPLTSTLIDRWYTITRSYSATFRQDLTVRKNELVQVLRCTHPHWIWVRNEDSHEGFIPTDCLMITELIPK